MWSDLVHFMLALYIRHGFAQSPCKHISCGTAVSQITLLTEDAGEQFPIPLDFFISLWSTSQTALHWSWLSTQHCFKSIFWLRFNCANVSTVKPSQDLTTLMWSLVLSVTLLAPGAAKTRPNKSMGDASSRLQMQREGLKQNHHSPEMSGRVSASQHEWETSTAQTSSAVWGCFLSVHHVTLSSLGGASACEHSGMARP